MILLLLAGFIALTSGNIKLSPNAVDAEKYLQQEINKTEIYLEKQKDEFYHPFNFSHTDFGKLILVSIDDHPEIKTVELVVQNDNKGAFVVIYYYNGKVETYPNDHLTLNRKYLKPNNDWEIMSTTDFTYSFENTPQGVLLDLDICIKNDTLIKIQVKENRKVTGHYSFLAAIGADLREVKRFPFIFLEDAGFIPISGTQCNFTIDGKKMNLTKVPIKVEGEKVYKTVYSFTPLPFFWNEKRDTVLQAYCLKKGIINLSKDAQYSFTNNNGHPEIKKIVYANGNHVSTYRFSPAFPDLANLKNGVRIAGKFCLGIDETEGVIGGNYRVEKKNDTLTVRMNPQKCWQPMIGKDWVKAYSYEAKLFPGDNHDTRIFSKWKIRTK